MQLTPSFRAIRWLRTTNLFLQTILSVTFFAGLNYLALHYSWRFDLTALRSHSLSAETRSYLRDLNQPVKIYVTLPRPGDATDVSMEAQAHRDVTDLLREYVYATEANEAGRISVEYLDVYQRGRDAQELGLSKPGPTLVVCGDKSHLVGPEELYLMAQGEKKAFLGEQAFTSAILDVSSPEKKKIYFLSGHGEMKTQSADENYGLSVLRNELRFRNFEVVDELDLTAHRIPDDATLIISAGPQNSYSPQEQEQLRQYLATRDSTHAGRLLLLLRPGVPSGLEDLLFDWGILADDVIIYDSDPASLNDTRELVLRSYDPTHPVVQQLVVGRMPVRFGISRSVRINPSRVADPSLLATRLIGTSPTAWGERSYLLRRTPEYNRGIDLPSDRLGLGVASERVTAKDKDLPFSVPAGRVIAFGCADFVTNNRLSGGYGNLTLALSSINWLVGRGAQLTVPARPIEKFQLSLSQQELLRLRYSLLLALPAAAGLLGLIVYWTRRR